MTLTAGGCRTESFATGIPGIGTGVCFAYSVIRTLCEGDVDEAVQLIVQVRLLRSENLAGLGVPVIAPPL